MNVPRIPRSFLVFVIIASLLGLNTPAAAATTRTWTTTADFDGGDKGDPGTEYFAHNGVDIPMYSFLTLPNSQYVAAHGSVHARTYFVYQGELTYLPFVAYYDHATGLFSDPVAAVNENPNAGDGHGAPSLFVTPDNRIHVFCCAHFSNITHARTTAPDDISTWETLSIVTTGGTYPSLFYYSNTLYITYRSGPSQGNTAWHYRTSTNNGATFSAATAFVALTDIDPDDGVYVYAPTLFGTDVWYSFILNDFPGVRRNVYVVRWDLTTNKQYGFDGFDMGTLVNLTEANAHAKVYTSQPVDVPNDGVWVTYATLFQGNPVVLWNQGNWSYYSGGNWSGKIRFSSYNGTAWSSPVDVTDADESSNYMAMIPYDSYVEAFITEDGLRGFGNSNGTPDLAFQYSGDMARWTWNVTQGWVRSGTIVSEAHAGFPVNFPSIPYGFHDDIRLMFAAWGPFAVTRAEGKIYAWGGAGEDFIPALNGGILHRSDQPSGNYGVETSTDSENSPSGSFVQASGNIDHFTKSINDTNTFKWNGFISGDSPGFCDPAHIEDGSLRYEYGGVGRRGCWIMTTWQAEPGDWTLSMQSSYAVRNPSWPGGSYLVEFHALDQPDHANNDDPNGFAEGFQSDTSGFFTRYSNHFEGGVIARVDDAIVTVLDDTVTGACVNGDAIPACYMRMTHTESNNTVKFERSSDGMTWTVDGWYGVPQLETWIFRFGFSASGPDATPTFHVWLNLTSWEFTGAHNAFRRSSSWSSPTVEYAGEIARNITVIYTGASTDAYIDSVRLEDPNTGEILFEDETDITSGSSHLYDLGNAYSTETVLLSHDIQIRVILAGDTASSITIQLVSLVTVRAASLVYLDQAVDIFWLLVYAMILIALVVSAWWIKERRGV